MLCMLKHTLFSCVYDKGVFSIHKITAALANLCISVYNGKLNLMLSSASKSQKITFILMKCTKNCCHHSCFFWPRYAPNRLSAGASLQTLLGELIAPPDPLAGLGGRTPRGKGRGRRGKGRGGVGGIGTPPPWEGKGMEGRVGWEGREGEGKEGEGRERK